jgi:MFS family permease
LGDYFGEKDRAKWLMWQSIVGSGCGTLLLSASGYLSTIAWYYPFVVYALAFLITGGAYFFIFEPQRKTEEQVQSTGTDDGKFPLKMMLSLAVTTLIASTLYFVYTLHFSLALDSMGIKDRQTIGNYSAIASVAVPIGGLLFRLISKKSSQFQFACLFGLIGLGLICIGLAVNIPTVVAGAWIQQLGGGMAIPILIAWGLKNVPPQYRGRGMGFWTSGFFLGQFISPLVVSALRNMTGSLLSTFIVCGIICLILAGYNLFLNKKDGVHS